MDNFALTKQREVSSMRAKGLVCCAWNASCKDVTSDFFIRYIDTAAGLN